MNILRGIKSEKKVELDVNILPSRGLFYKDDFKIFIKPVSEKDIEEYELNYNSDDVLDSIFRIKKIIANYTILPNGYDYNDIKSADIIFIFLEIVKLTTGKPVWLYFFDYFSGKIKKIKFSKKSFSYFDYSNLMEYYNNEKKVFEINGFKYNLPSIGVETSLSNFLMSNQVNSDYFKNKNYNFIYFIGNKKILSESELKNLIELFNEDLSDEDSINLKNTFEKFEGTTKYFVKTKSGLIPISVLNFGEIFS